MLITESALSIGGENQLITMTLDQAIEKAELPDITLTDSTARAALSGIDGAVISEVYGDIMAISMMNIPEWQKNAEMELVFASRMPAIIGPSTRITVDNVQLNMPRGSANGTGTLGFTGTAPINLQDGADMSARLDGEVSARIDKQALVWLIAGRALTEIQNRFAEAGQPLDDAVAEQLAADAAMGQLNVFEAQSLIKRDGDDAYTVDARIGNGQMILNGINRPDLFGTTPVTP